MAQELCVIVSAEDRGRLAAIIDDRNQPLKHIQRAKIGYPWCIVLGVVLPFFFV